MECIERQTEQKCYLNQQELYKEIRCILQRNSSVFTSQILTYAVLLEQSIISNRKPGN
jgi:hypothetical protein